MTNKVWAKKEWLLANGHIDAISRGRISLANHALLQAATAAGTKFSDFATTTKVDNGVTIVKSVVVNTEKVVADVPDARWPVATTKVYTLDGVLTKATTRSACFNCSCSLAYCTCDLRGDLPYAIVSNTSGYVPVRLEV